MDEFLIWGGYPEVVLTNSFDDKKQVLNDIFDFWFNKDVLLETKRVFEIKKMVKYLAYGLGNILNYSEV